MLEGGWEYSEASWRAAARRVASPRLSQGDLREWLYAIRKEDARLAELAKHEHVMVHRSKQVLQCKFCNLVRTRNQEERITLARIEAELGKLGTLTENKDGSWTLSTDERSALESVRAILGDEYTVEWIGEGNIYVTAATRKP